MTTLSTAFAQGTTANRPAASASNTGFYYLETDTNGGTLFQSTGSAWVQLAPGVSAAGGGTYPKFMVNLNGTDLSVPAATATKIPWNTAVFDTNSNFDVTTNHRFTPTVAGYYQLSVGGRFNNVSTVGEYYISLYKNGAEALRGEIDTTATSAVGYYTASVNALLYCNGTTDYVETYAYGGAATTVQGNTLLSWFSGGMMP